MKAIILLAFIGSAFGALVPAAVSPPLFYSNLISPHRPDLPIQHLDATPLNVFTPQQYIAFDIPQVNTAVRTIPTAVFANGRPSIAHIPTTYNYYGTPVYDFRFAYNPIPSPGLIPSTPGYVPRPEIPQPPKKPTDDDGIEKLDEKVDPADDRPGAEKGGADNKVKISEEKESVSVEAAT